jgi:polyribonucleotide nucleotidyltransferase
MLEAIKFAHEHIKQISAQLRLQAFFGKKVRTYEGEREDEAIASKAASYDKIYAIASKGSAKQERTAAFEEVKKK